MMVQRMFGDPDLCGVSFAAALDLLMPYTSVTLICGEALRDVAEYIEKEYRVSPPLILPDEVMVKCSAWSVVDGTKVVYSVPVY
jgi:hypothetical protein